MTFGRNLAKSVGFQPNRALVRRRTVARSPRPSSSSPRHRGRLSERERFFVAMAPKLDLSGYQYSAMVRCASAASPAESRALIEPFSAISLILGVSSHHVREPLASPRQRAHRRRGIPRRPDRPQSDGFPRVQGRYRPRGQAQEGREGAGEARKEGRGFWWETQAHRRRNPLRRCFGGNSRLFVTRPAPPLHTSAHAVL